MIQPQLLEKALNAYLNLDPEVQKSLKDLVGRRVKIHVTDLDMPFFLSFQLDPKSDKKNQVFIQVSSEEMQSIDATIQGHSWRLLSAPISDISAKQIKIEGDAEIGYQVYGLFKEIDIDWEEHLSHHTGDVIAHQIGSVVRSVKKTFGRAADRFTQNMTEYTQEEMPLFPSEQEVEDFCGDVKDLRERTDRLIALYEKGKQKDSPR